MKRRFKDCLHMYRIYRQVNPPLQAVRLAWVLSGE